MYWIFAGMWFSSFLVWTALVFSPGKRRLGLRLFLFLLPVVMFGACIVQVHTYTICPCFQCPYMDWAARRALVASIYAFNIGRLVVFPLSMYVIATGCGTIYSQMPTRGWLVILLVFGGFAASLGCIIPNESIDLPAAQVGAILMYVSVYLVVLAVAHLVERAAHPV